MAFKNRNADDIALDRVAIKLSNMGLTSEPQHFEYSYKKPAGDLE